MTDPLKIKNEKNNERKFPINFYNFLNKNKFIIICNKLNNKTTIETNFVRNMRYTKTTIVVRLDKGNMVKMIEKKNVYYRYDCYIVNHKFVRINSHTITNWQ